MSIKPFVDKSYVDIGKSVNRRVSNTDGMKTKKVDPFRQGVSIRDTMDRGKRILPFIGARTLPAYIYDKIDHTLETTSFGDAIILDDIINGDTLTPFDDIDSLDNPVAFIDDPGITAYPQVLLSPAWLDPGMMNGTIEPLDIRSTLPGMSIDSPFVAHTVRASIIIPENAGSHYVDYHSILETEYVTPFIDAANISMENESTKIASEGISDFGNSRCSPCNTEKLHSSIKNSLKTFTQSIFNDTPGLGIYQKRVSSSIIVFNTSISVEEGSTGIRTATGTDSIAFGGLSR